MDREYVVLSLILLSLITVSACTSSSGHQVAVSGNIVTGQSSFGIEKGQFPPDFTIKTIDGKELKLSQFRNDRPILLYFWATWCPFCRQDFTVVREIYPKYADKVAFLAIDLDISENSEIIKQYKDKMKLEGIDFAEGDANILSNYQITHTTTKYAIAKNGAILYKGSGVFNEQQWEILFNGLVNS